MALAESAHVTRQRGAELASRVNGNLVGPRRRFPDFLLADSYDGTALIVHLRQHGDRTRLSAIANASEAHDSHRRIADMALRLLRLEAMGHDVSVHEVPSLETSLRLGPVSTFGSRGLTETTLS